MKESESPDITPQGDADMRWEFLTPSQKNNLPMSAVLEAWENSNPETKLEIEKLIKKRAGGFLGYLIILRNLSKNSGLFEKVLFWAKKNAKGIVKAVFLENFLDNNLKFKNSF